MLLATIYCNFRKKMTIYWKTADVIKNWVIVVKNLSLCSEKAALTGSGLSKG